MADGYDIIGDIHGHADPLRRLLRTLGYEEQNGIFRHPGRRVIFVGDFVDRGPEQVATLQIAKGMCDAGLARAVMGNHEFNALLWAEPDGSGSYLRPHTQKNAHQHREFLRQIGEINGSRASSRMVREPPAMDRSPRTASHPCLLERIRPENAIQLS